jgi:site-specific DNA-methyltransferase (adenine-specific)
MSQPVLPRNQILVGDVRTRLAELPDASVNCIITSPPYFALRDYGHQDQMGAEATVDGWVDGLAAICTELKRVLRPDGALFLNLGDGYSRHPREGADKKSLLLGPERLALRLTNTGWLLRNKVVWAKRNPMPSSVTDRLSTTHEFVYFFTRAPHYYFDLDAIRRTTDSAVLRPQPSPRRSRAAHYPPRTAVPTVPGGSAPRVDLNQGLVDLRAAGRDTHPLGKNPGDVWELATASYRGAHFATFPVELVRRPLLATCPERVCDHCGTAWRRAAQSIDGRRLHIGPLRPACACRTTWRPGVVLDPFMGSGTVALAAEQHRRDWIGIELNPTYARMADERLRRERTRPNTNNNEAA